MPELELLRSVAPDVTPATPAARAHARATLERRIEGARRRPALLAPRRLVPLAGLGAVTAVAVVVFLSVGSGGTSTASAAGALREAAATARAQEPPPVLRPGEFVYTKSTTAYLATAIDGQDGSDSYSVLLPSERETWLGPDGTGWLYERSGTPRFLGERDRAAWTAAGMPSLPGGTVTNVELANSDGSTPPMGSLDLPSDPDALWDHLEADARGKGSGLQAQMFELVASALRETFTTPQQRAALYEVAARIPGVELVGPVTDPAGRPGIAVARNDSVRRIRYELVFDPHTAALLAEVQVVLSGNDFGYPEGTQIGESAYLESAVVDTIRTRPDGSVVSAACSNGRLAEQGTGCPG